jgi:hypothetical protein
MILAFRGGGGALGKALFLDMYYMKNPVSTSWRTPYTSITKTFGEFTIYNGPTNALVCDKTLIQMSHIKNT